MLCFLVLGVISTAGDGIRSQFNVASEGLFGFIASTILIGALCGSIIAGMLASRYGRRMTIVIGGLICAFAGAAQGFAPELWVLLTTRLILGVGVGISVVVCPLFVSEAAPMTQRGFFGVFFQLAVCFGILVGNIIGYAIILTKVDAYLGWRIMLALGSVFPAVLVILGMLFVEETHEWLSSRGEDETRRLQPTSSEIGDGVVPAKQGWSLLFSRQSLSSVILATVLAATAQLTGIIALFCLMKRDQCCDVLQP